MHFTQLSWIHASSGTSHPVTYQAKMLDSSVASSSSSGTMGRGQRTRSPLDHLQVEGSYQRRRPREYFHELFQDKYKDCSEIPITSKLFLIYWRLP